MSIVLPMFFLCSLLVLNNVNKQNVLKRKVQMSKWGKINFMRIMVHVHGTTKCMTNVVMFIFTF